MITKIISPVLMINFLVLFTNSMILPAKAQSNQNIYSCIEYQGKPITVVDTERGRIQIIIWESNYFSTSGWTPQARCEEVTIRFQRFSDNSTLKYITTGQVTSITGGKYNVICVASQQPPPGENIQCDENGTLITLEPQDNPQTVMKNLFQGATEVGGLPIRRGQTTLDVQRYLKEAPLMTGSESSTGAEPPPTQLQQSPPAVIRGNEANPIDDGFCPPILCD